MPITSSIPIRDVLDRYETLRIARIIRIVQQYGSQIRCRPSLHGAGSFLQKNQQDQLLLAHPTLFSRERGRLALAVGCVCLAVASIGIASIAALNTIEFREIEAAFYDAPLIENVPRIGAGAFRPRMIAIGVDGLIMAIVTWYLFLHRGSRSGAGASRRDVLAGATLFFLCGLALTSFVASCFLQVPALDRACFLHAKEGLIDTIHPIAFGSAAILLGMTALRSFRKQQTDRVITVCIATIAVALFVVAMEEISWGQTFLGWQTPDSVSAWNYQNETNLHNAFNFVLGRAYLAAGLIGFLAIAASIMFRRAKPDHPLSVVLPSSPMFWGALWLPPASQGGIYTDTEPFESILAILAVYYAIEIWRRLTPGASAISSA